MRLRFADANNNDINMFQSLENPCTFLFTKEKTWKRIFNSELPQNRTEKQIMPFKTTMNWLVNDIWCYLLIACFDWEVGVFQHAFVRFYYINTYWTLLDEPQKKKIFPVPYRVSFSKVSRLVLWQFFLLFEKLYVNVRYDFNTICFLILLFFNLYWN